MYNLLSVEYDPQYDDKNNELYTNCNINALGMALRMDGSMNRHATDDYLYKLLKSKEAHAHAKKLIAAGNAWIQSYVKYDQLKQVFSMLNWAARYVIGNGDISLGKKYSNFYLKIPLAAMRDEIDRGYPVVISGNFFNLSRTKKYDHIMTIVGYDNWGFLCHDPGGNLIQDENFNVDEYAAYFSKIPKTNTIKSGEYAHYPYEWIRKSMNGGLNDLKWGLFIHADKAMPIEIPLIFNQDFFMKV